jgi:hypothetical protein
MSPHIPHAPRLLQGCGSGRDCYVCAALVGPDGSVTGAGRHGGRRGAGGRA